MNINLPCPHCGEQEAALQLKLNTMDTSLHCADCEADFTREEVEDMISKWTKFFLWVDTAPTIV